ncbi:MAG: MarR family transcriptional regulator [Deltaproteobacteria bacterium]|nr:MAG: MarR family transcriptional regulator [Deltaproteobacteria bacterium]
MGVYFSCTNSHREGREMLFKDCLCFQVGKIARKMSEITREKVASYDLTTTQFFLLIALYEQDGIFISTLAHKLALRKATLTGLLDRLERDGFTERRADPQDRRVMRIHLTPKAEKLRDELTQIYHENNHMFLSLLSKEEQEVFEQVVCNIETTDKKG